MKIKHIICALALSTSLLAAEPVAQVEKMYGQENLFRQKTEAAQWYRSFLEQNASIGNHFKTDPGSWANIRFFLGGKLSLGKDCEVEIVSEREGEVIREAIHLKKGTFWAKFDKQKAHPVKIRTAGGVMGIRGTEFVVQLLPDGSTKLSLLEGDVGVEAGGGNAGARPGDEIIFGSGASTSQNSFSQADLRQRLKDDLGPMYDELLGAINDLGYAFLKADLPRRTATLNKTSHKVTAILENRARNGQERNEAVDKYKDEADFDKANETLARLEQLLADAPQGRETTTASTQDETMSDIQKILAGQAPDSETAARKTNDSTPLRAGENLTVLAPRPTINWTSLSCPKYGIAFFAPTKEDQVEWADITDQLNYTMPEDAEPLPPGRHKFRIIPLNTENEVAGEALEGFFLVQRLESSSEKSKERATARR